MDQRLGRGLDSLISRTLPRETADRTSEIPLTAIRMNPNQPRKQFDEEALAGLAHSIQQLGVLQPIVVRRVTEDSFELVAGERRYRASRILGRATIPATVIDAEGLRSLEVALIENIQRENLSPLDEASAYEQLAAQTELTHRELAERVGKSRSAVTNSLRLLELPDEIKALLRSGQLSAGQARALLGAGTKSRMIQLAEGAAGQSWSVREVERRVRAVKPPSPGPSPRARTRPTPRAATYEDDLRTIYGTKVSIADRDGRGEVRFAFYSAEDRDRLLHLLLTARARSGAD